MHSGRNKHGHFLTINVVLELISATKDAVAKVQFQPIHYMQDSQALSCAFYVAI